MSNKKRLHYLCVLLVLVSITVLVSSVSAACPQPFCGITVISPNGGEIWEGGTVHTITWSYHGWYDETVQIQLMKGYGNNVVEVIDDSILATYGSFDWLIPSSLTPGTDYWIKVKAIGDDFQGETAGWLTIGSPPATIHLTSPNGCELWTKDTDKTITWSYSGSSTSKVDIFVVNASENWVSTLIASGVPIGSAGIGSDTWHVPPNFATGDYEVYIEISSLLPTYSIGDWSDKSFSIGLSDYPITVTSPQSGETWWFGSTNLITWTFSSCISPDSNVRISLLKGGTLVDDIYHKDIPIGVNGIGSQSWPFPLYPSVQFPEANNYQVAVNWTCPAVCPLPWPSGISGFFTVSSGIPTPPTTSPTTIPTTSPTLIPTTLPTPIPTISPPTPTANKQMKLGIYQNGVWYLDSNGNDMWDTHDWAYNFGAPGWTPITGDWNATGNSNIGVTNGQSWYLDWNGNGAWDAGTDKAYNFGAPGWTPITGDWNPAVNGTKIGVTNGQQWYLDWNGNGAWDAGTDKAYNFGAPEWTPILGDWNGDGTGTKIGVTNGQQWYLDWNGNGAWDAADQASNFGAPRWTPVVGEWS